MPSASVPLHTATRVDTGLLDFDANNPRFSEDGQRSFTDAETIAALADTADLQEIIQSISTNGYIDIEPLIVMEKGARFTVLEGNRRLAAMKLLTDPQLASDARIALPTMTDALRPSLETASVYRGSSGLCCITR